MKCNLNSCHFLAGKAHLREALLLHEEAMRVNRMCRELRKKVRVNKMSREIRSGAKFQVPISPNLTVVLTIVLEICRTCCRGCCAPRTTGA